MFGWDFASLSFVRPPYIRPIMRTSSGPNHSSGLHMGGRPAKEYELRRTDGGFDSLSVVVDRAPPVDHPSPSDKGKGKISEIRYLSGSEYLKAAVKYADIVGPSRIEPLYEKTFVTCYRHRLGVQVWCPDLLTSYIIQAPKMVCIFDAALDNSLRFSLHSLSDHPFCIDCISIQLDERPSDSSKLHPIINRKSIINNKY